MFKFLTGIIIGIIISSVGFNGLATAGNKAVNGVKSFAVSVSN
jgi:hypothetical protein